jgi:uncharacterized protein YdeI (YjbR/CyaY-like superfamily)
VPGKSSGSGGARARIISPGGCKALGGTRAYSSRAGVEPIPDGLPFYGRAARQACFEPRLSVAVRGGRLWGVPSVVPNPKSILPFASASAFEAWLSKNHDRRTEVWIKIYKKGSGKPSIDASQAIDVALCWGWIDGIRKAFDEEAFLQRYTPRTAKSRWSRINVERVELLRKAGRMTEHGQAHIDAAKADGRWAAAYPPPSALEVPEDFLAAVSKNRAALDVYRALNKQNTNAIAYRLHHIASAERRAKWIAEMVQKLSRAETPHPARAASPAKTKPRRRKT